MTTTAAPFATVSRLEPIGPGTYAADVHPLWTIAAKPNGGYLLALLARAAVDVSAQPHVIAASAHYLHSPEPGAVQITAEVLRAGRSASQIRTRLTQDGTPCIEALITVSTLTAETAPTWAGGIPDMPRRPFDECVRLGGTTPTGLPLPIMEQVQVRIDPDDLGFGLGKPRGIGELRGWLALPDDEPFDPTSLLYAADSFPPATLDVALSGWVPTLELTVYVRGLPAPGPVRVLHKAHLIQAEKVVESCWVWDSREQLVAQSTQLAGVRLI